MKRQLILFITAMVLNGFTIAQNIQDGLLIYFPFNNSCDDMSGNDFHGVNYNASFTVDPWGNENSACEFNGFNTHVELIDEPSLKPPLPLSFSFWVKFHSLEASNSQIFITDFSKNMYAGVWFGLNPDTHQMQMSIGSGIPDCTGPECRRTKVGTTVFQTDVWYFIIGIIRTATDMNIYVNCEDDGGYYSGNGYELAYTESLGSIGRTDQQLVLPYYFHGALDEFRYWNRTLSILEMAELCLMSANQTMESDAKIAPFMLLTNPVTTDILLQYKQEIDQASYQIYNILGEIVAEGILTSEAADISASGFIAGTYILSIDYKGNTYRQKFVKY